MLLTNEVLEGIVNGKVDRVFRKWARPTVRAGGTLKTRRGVLEILSLGVVARSALTEQDAKRSGSVSLEQLLRALDRGAGQEIYRIGVRFGGVDPRIELRTKALTSPEELRAMVIRLDRMDASSTAGPWTRQSLRLIHENPARRAEDLAKMLGWEKRPFKTQVRKLKTLGLTQSLEIGYRLSPRGESLMSFLRSERGATLLDP